MEYTYQYMEVIGCESVKSGQVTEEFIHIIVTAYFNGMFEVVRHNMDRDARPPLCEDAQPTTTWRASALCSIPSPESMQAVPPIWVQPSEFAQQVSKN